MKGKQCTREQDILIGVEGDPRIRYAGLKCHSVTHLFVSKRQNNGSKY